MPIALKYSSVGRARNARNRMQAAGITADLFKIRSVKAVWRGIVHATRSRVQFFRSGQSRPFHTESPDAVSFLGT
jgi:hypothetical protein